MTQTYLSGLYFSSVHRDSFSYLYLAQPTSNLHSATFCSFIKDYLKCHILRTIFPVPLHLSAQSILYFSSVTYHIMPYVMTTFLHLIGWSHHSLYIQIYDVLKVHQSQKIKFTERHTICVGRDTIKKNEIILANCINFQVKNDEWAM